MAKSEKVYFNLLSERDKTSIRNNKGKYPSFPDDSYKSAKDRIDNFYYQGQIEQWRNTLKLQEKK